MRQYPQTWDKIGIPPSEKSLNKIGSRIGTVDELIVIYRDFFKKELTAEFNRIVKYVWLKHQYTYGGIGIDIQSEVGLFLNKVYGYFMKNMVGVTQKTLVDGLSFPAISSYIPDLFPEFYTHNVLDEPEYFKFPYKNISICHMVLVYQCDERIEMLQYADEKAMSYGDFRDWAANYLMSIDPYKYELHFWHNTEYIKKMNKGGKRKK